MDTPGYQERLGVPLRWWVQGTMFVATLWLALIVAVPGLAAWLITGACLGLLTLWLFAYGRARIEVRDGWLQAGPARIEGRHLGAVEALDADATRRSAGRDADARAFLLLRPYLTRAVKVEITDPADPAPYWLISTRHPERLAGAVQQLAAAQA